MLAYVLSRMLVTLLRLETLSHMQADHHSVGLEADIPLTHPRIHSFIVIDVYMSLVCSDRIIDNNMGSRLRVASSLVEPGACAWWSWAGRDWTGCKKKPEIWW